jgi:hypothetical protein
MGGERRDLVLECEQREAGERSVLYLGNSHVARLASGSDATSVALSASLPPLSQIGRFGVPTVPAEE